MSEMAVLGSGGSGTGEPGDPAGRLATARRAAMQWQVTLWSGEVTSQERLAFEAWLRADPLHETAWQAVQRIGQQIQAVPASIASPVLKSAPAVRSQRRAVLRGAAWLTGAGVAAWMVRTTPQWQVAMADFRTARGEHRELVLPEGSRITLNTGTAVEVQFDARQRRLLLLSGEVFIATAPDNHPQPRPFLVETREGVVRPVGTRFAVRRLEDASPSRSLVQVVEGAVELFPRNGTSSVRVEAGQKADFTRATAGGVRPADPSEVAWLRGLLVAERMRLADFLAELGRYRSGVLRCDPAVAELVISGVFPLADTDAVLRAMAQALPVRVRSVTRYWITVMAR